MEGDSNASNPKELPPPEMSYPSQQPLPTYAQAVNAPVYQQPYYPNQFGPGPQPVVYQPAQYVVATTIAAPLQPVYSDYMCWSIMSILFCCLPLGVVALIFSCKTQDANARQDQNNARDHSSTARALNISAMMFGIIFYIFLTVYMNIR